MSRASERNRLTLAAASPYLVPCSKEFKKEEDESHDHVFHDESVILALDRAATGADFPDALIAVTHELFGTETTVTFDKRAAKRLGWRLLA